MNLGSRGIRRACVVLAALTPLAACGSRVSGAEVLADGGGARVVVSLPPDLIQELQRAATRRSPPESVTTPVTTPRQPTHSAPNAPTGAEALPATAPPTKTAAPAAAAAASTAAAPPAMQVDPDQPGCTGRLVPVALGQVGAFSGVTGPLTSGARIALATWAQAVNARGGLACHPVVLYQVDDGADPAKAASLVQDLVANKGVQALVGVFDALAFQGVVSGVEKAKVPVVGGDGIDFAWNANPYLFPTGAGLLGLVRGAIHQTLASGKTNFGLLYCVEASACIIGSKIIPPEVEKAGGKLTYSSAISLTQTDFTAQCQNAKTAGVQALGVAMDGASIGRVARSCAAINYHPQFVANGLVLSAQNGQDPDVRHNTLSSSSAVTPWMLDDTTGQKEYHAALAKYAPNATPDASSITAWAAGKLLEAAINGLGAKARATPITTADIITGLDTIHSQTLGGLTPPITFLPGQKAAPLMDCAYFELLTDKGWTAPNASSPVCGGRPRAMAARTAAEDPDHIDLN